MLGTVGNVIAIIWILFFKVQLGELQYWGKQLLSFLKTNFQKQQKNQKSQLVIVSQAARRSDLIMWKLI